MSVVPNERCPLRLLLLLVLLTTTTTTTTTTTRPSKKTRADDDDDDDDDYDARKKKNKKSRSAASFSLFYLSIFVFARFFFCETFFPISNWLHSKREREIDIHSSYASARTQTRREREREIQREIRAQRRENIFSYFSPKLSLFFAQKRNTHTHAYTHIVDIEILGVSREREKYGKNALCSESFC